MNALNIKLYLLSLDFHIKYGIWSSVVKVHESIGKQGPVAITKYLRNSSNSKELRHTQAELQERFNDGLIN